MQLYIGDLEHQLTPEDPYSTCISEMSSERGVLGDSMGHTRGMMSVNLRISWRTVSVYSLQALAPLICLVNPLLFEFCSIQKRVGKRKPWS